jgi:nitrate/nitrite-specific signal transduction histidine kinase
MITTEVAATTTEPALPEAVTKLKTALRLKNQEIEVLHQISQAISGNLNLEEVLHHIIELVTQVTKGDSCLLYLLDKVNEELVLRASKNPTQIIGRIKKLGEGMGQGGTGRHTKGCQQ